MKPWQAWSSPWRWSPVTPLRMLRQNPRKGRHSSWPADIDLAKSWKTGTPCLSAPSRRSTSFTWFCMSAVGHHHLDVEPSDTTENVKARTKSRKTSSQPAQVDLFCQTARRQTHSVTTTSRKSPHWTWYCISSCFQHGECILLCVVWKSLPCVNSWCLNFGIFHYCSWAVVNIISHVSLVYWHIWSKGILQHTWWSEWVLCFVNSMNESHRLSSGQMRVNYQNLGK